jgi:hypothetical protein
MLGCPVYASKLTFAGFFFLPLFRIDRHRFDPMAMVLGLISTIGDHPIVPLQDI